MDVCTKCFYSMLPMHKVNESSQFILSISCYPLAQTKLDTYYTTNYNTKNYKFFKNMAKSAEVVAHCLSVCLSVCLEARTENHLRAEVDRLSEDRGEMMMRSSRVKRGRGHRTGARQTGGYFASNCGRERGEKKERVFYCVLKRLFTFRPEQTRPLLRREEVETGRQVQWAWVNITKLTP